MNEILSDFLLVFNDFDSMYNALNKGHVDGILMEMYAASYAIKEKGDDNLKLAKFYSYPDEISFVVANPRALHSQVRDCLKRVFRFRQNDVTLTVNRFSKDAKVGTINSPLQQLFSRF